jgi:hypothetical protein
MRRKAAGHEQHSERYHSIARQGIEGILARA